MRDSIQALALVQKELGKLTQENVEFLAAARAKTFDEYTKICGVIRGLYLADAFINDLVQKLERE